ncbi:hypothetical protein [uncultured Fusobacterium sp.]|uniref:hypothetical protein n=1 Tax=uncultured Fusobacterium sp. TaxID=159267 RepID=UPI000BBAB316|nr:hypothetical protein [uncultured Fusobacterium sp.]BBA52736.1 hypothetical protein FV113G1_30870 [Fusobacterium varium]
MKKLTLTILHRLPNRVRLKLSVPIKNFDSFERNITHDIKESIDIKYTPVTRTVTAKFDPESIYLQEVIYKILTAFSIENGMIPVKLLEGTEQKAMERFSVYSGATIIMSGLHMLMNKNGTELQNMMNWFSLGMTSAAIFEHACIEINKKGVFDLEILPAMYLVKSFLNTPKLSLVAMIWLTTFGRHLITTSNSAKEIKIFRIKNQKDNKYHYIANISDDHSIENIGDLLYHIFFRKGRDLVKPSEKYITINK